MSCCDGKPCGPGCDDPLFSSAPTPEDTPSRYPEVAPEAHNWKKADAPALSQFDEYGKGCCNGRSCCANPPPYTYTGENLNVCDFPIGGFAAGNVILHGDGTLQGWMVVNQTRNETLPMHDIPACFFGISAQSKSATAPQSFLLASPETYTEQNCRRPASEPAKVSPESVARLQALPGVKALTLVGKYPIADVSYDITGFPVDVSLEAMSAMIPGSDPQDVKDSSLPAAIFTFTLKNPGTESVSVKLLEAQQNFIGWNGQTDCTQAATQASSWGGNINTPFARTGASGLTMTGGVDATSPYTGTVTVTAITGSNSDSGASTATVLPAAATEEELWAAFTGGKDVPASSAAPTPASAKGASYAGGVVQAVEVPAGGTVTVTFVLTWHFPNRTKSLCCGNGRPNLPDVLGNRYNAWFKDSAAVSAYVQANLERLTSVTRVYRDTMFASTVPWQLLDSAAGRAAVARCPTMFWSEEGIVLGTEGNGCCPLNCTHVYGYTTLLERLFPTLAKDMRVSDFVRNYDPSAGGCTMRFGTGGWAIDGALACIIKTYLAVQQADGEAKWLPTVWDNVKAQMSAIMTKFDVDGDGVIRAAQQNTYDTSMLEANTFIGSYYVTALRATAKMAILMGENDYAAALDKRAALSAASYDKICWNEKFGYYTSDVTEATCKNSYGPGVFVDQLCAAGLSCATGLGYVFNPAHEASARKAIVKYNIVTCPPWKDMQKHLFPGDQGVTVCTYPNGKLGAGMRYDTLVSTGFTSPVVAGLVLDRNMKDALTVASLIRKKQDGRNRSPWNEPECNVLYSRTMAHWNMFDQACGFRYDSTVDGGTIAYDPRLAAGSTNANFKCFTIVQDGWGEYTQQGPTGLASGTLSLSCLRGFMALGKIGVPSTATAVKVSLGGQAVAAALAKDAETGLTFVTLTAGPVKIPAGSTLMISLSGSVGIDIADLDVDANATISGSPLRRRAKGQKDAVAQLVADSVHQSQAAVVGASAQQPLMLVLVAVVMFLLGSLWQRYSGSPVV